MISKWLTKVLRAVIGSPLGHRNNGLYLSATPSKIGRLSDSQGDLHFLAHNTHKYFLLQRELLLATRLVMAETVVASRSGMRIDMAGY